MLEQTPQVELLKRDETKKKVWVIKYFLIHHFAVMYDVHMSFPTDLLLCVCPPCSFVRAALQSLRTIHCHTMVGTKQHFVTYC